MNSDTKTSKAPRKKVFSITVWKLNTVLFIVVLFLETTDVGETVGNPPN